MLKKLSPLILLIASIIWGAAFVAQKAASELAPFSVTLAALSTISLQIHLTEKSAHPADAATVKILITDLEKPLLAPNIAPKSAHTATMAKRPTEMYAPMLPLFKVGCIYSIIFVKSIISILSVGLDTTIILHFSGKVKSFKVFIDAWIMFFICGKTKKVDSFPAHQN